MRRVYVASYLLTSSCLVTSTLHAITTPLDAPSSVLLVIAAELDIVRVGPFDVFVVQYGLLVRGMFDRLRVRQADVLQGERDEQAGSSDARSDDDHRSLRLVLRAGERIARCRAERVLRCEADRVRVGLLRHRRVGHVYGELVGYSVGPDAAADGASNTSGEVVDLFNVRSSVHVAG